MNTRSAIFALLIAVVSATALFAQGADEIAAAGTFDGQMYTNRKLGLSILAPGGWQFFPYARNQDLVARNRATNKDPDAINTQVLFQATPAKLLGGEMSATFSAGIQTGVRSKTSAEYAAKNLDFLTRNFALTLTRDISDLRLGNATFSVFEVTGKAEGKEYRQTYLATVRRGMAIFFVETFYDNKNTFAAEASLKTVRLK